jgi:hypothetical protein
LPTGQFLNGQPSLIKGEKLKKQKRGRIILKITRGRIFKEIKKGENLLILIN